MGKRNSKKILILFILGSFLITACSGVGLFFDCVYKIVGLTTDHATPQSNPTSVPPLVSEIHGDMESIQAGFSNVYDRVVPSVVNIQVVQVIEGGAIPDMDNFFFPPQFPFGQPEQNGEFRRSGLGSGFVWDQKGHIITNYHVIKDADQIQVTFHDGTSVDGEVIGSDRDSDLAVIKVDFDRSLLDPIELTDSTEVKVGQLVAAVGNPFGLEGTMTVGIVSALGRSLPVQSSTIQGSTYSIPDVIQTDAPINPGNSGGVLVDMDGRLVGVPTAIESSSGVNAGVGFVIPSVIIQRIVPVLIEDGVYDHPWIGISGTTLASDMAEEMNLERDQRGLLVVNVVPDSPADEAGLIGSDQAMEIDGQEMRLGGDVIIGIDDSLVGDFEDLTAYLARYTSAEEEIQLKVLRNGEEVVLDLTLGIRPTSSEESKETNRSSEKAWLGILGLTLYPEITEVMDLSVDQTGVLIQQVIPDSPADKAGLIGSYKSVQINGKEILVGGDVITSLDRTKVQDKEGLQSGLKYYGPGDVIILSVLRGGKSISVEVTLEVRP